MFTVSPAHVVPSISSKCAVTYIYVTPQMPNAAASISRAVEVAHRAGTLVVLTAGDAGLVQRNRPQLLEALRQGADVLFTNRYARTTSPCAASAHTLPLPLFAGTDAAPDARSQAKTSE